MRVTLARAATLVAVLCQRSPSRLPPRRRAARRAPSCRSPAPAARRRSTTPIPSTTSWPDWSACPSRAGRSAARSRVPATRSGPGITVTWLVHDVEPWRVDRIYLGGKDGPWISTQVSDFSGPHLGQPCAVAPPGGRRSSRRPARRPGTGHQGVEGHLLRRRRRRTPPHPERQRRPEPAAVQPKSAAPSGQAWYVSAGWAIGGLVAGALLALAWTRRRSDQRRRAGPALGGADGYAEVLVR